MLSLRARAATLLTVTACCAGGLGAQQTVPPPVANAAGKAEPVDRVVAVVGDRPILLSEVMEYIYAQKGRGMDIPSDSAGFVALQHTVLDKLIDDEVLVRAAKLYKIDVTDVEVQASVDKFIKQVKSTFKTEVEFRDALKQSGFGNENEFRKFRAEQDKRDLLTQRGLDSLRAHGRMSAPVNVSEAEVTAAFEKAKGTFPKRPTTIAFRQIVIAPKPSPAARQAALAKAESLLVAVNSKGADFAQIAKRESMDPSSKDAGGDLGWNRRGIMVAEFDRILFALSEGQVSPFVVETSFGFHIIKVDRVQPAERKARHILIVPKLDSTDVVRAKLVADTVLRLWKAGTPFDTLVARYHDNAELRGIPEGMPLDSLPDNYKKPVEGMKAGQWTQPFEIPNPRTGFPKISIIQVTDRVEGGEYTKADLRDKIRAQLQQERQGRRMLDQLRKELFVAIRM
ncbi:MAG TPA: peptidylprolyl isomerase [Gemmatimonadaceae bacterium]|nr:peptidylprolyl isomerase [Gemmatimonadaceae bacterium]